MKKIFILTACLSLLLVFNKVNAVEENNSFGIEMYKFSKPRIAKEVTIVNVYPNTAAWNAGIRIADRILKVNDIDVTEKTLEEVGSLMSSNSDGTVKLTLKTKYGIKDFSIKKEPFNVNDIATYPQWKNLCGNEKTEDEACYIHHDDVVKKLIEFGYGPFYVSTIGTGLANKRYIYEDNLNICTKSKDPAMCYIQLQQNMQMQSINNSLNNINANVRMLR